MITNVTPFLCLYSVESFKEIQDSLCVGQKSGTSLEERVILFIKMVSGVNLGPELIKQIQASIRSQLSARHVPSVILEIADIPVNRHFSPWQSALSGPIILFRC